MKITTFLTLFVCFVLQSGFAQDWESFCNKRNEQSYSTDTVKCELQNQGHEVSPLRQMMVSELGSKFDDWTLISHAGQILQKRLQTEIDEEKDFLRYLRGDRGHEKQLPKYRALESDYKKLKRIVSELRNIQKCLSEICQHDREILNELKFSILSSNIYLAEPEVEKCIVQEIENSSKTSCRTSAFFSSVYNFVNSRMDLKEELSIQRYGENIALVNGVQSYKLHQMIYPFKGSENYYNAILPEIYRLAKNDPKRYGQTACRIIDKKEFRDRVYLASEITLEAGLCIAPFFFPPVAITRVGRIAYLSRYGLSTEKVVSAGVSVVTAAGLSSLQLKNEEKKCISLQESYRSNPSADLYLKYKNCLSELTDQKLMMSAGLVLAVGVPLPFSHRLEKIATKGIIALKEEAGAVLTAIRPIEAKAKKIADSYYDYVANVYQKRLNLSNDEIKSFMESSREMGDRTLLIVKTKMNPANGPPDFKGGIGIVHSTNKDELLPLEKATGFRVPRKPNEKSIEIVRLVSTDESNPNLMKELLNEALVNVATDPGVKSAYVYTSRIHERLYRKLGISYKIIEKPNSRDVILEFEVPR